ncbi:MAG: DUF4954 family protein, partial [Planctomycetota bacterium]|nr:DUF4954 family protein [Planctomycetota bacterium]
MDLRPLAPAEIGELSAAGCRSADWSQVRVAPAFAVQGRLREVEFSGWVELGVFNAELPDLGGRTRPTGVFFSSLHNVSLADDSLVRHSDLVNVRVGKGAWVNRVGLLAGEGESHFANGQEVKVLSEDGTRSVPLWRRLSATLAHILCRRRGRREAEALRELMARDWTSLASDCSWVGPGARVERSGRLSNIYLEEGARLDGVAELFDCYVASSLASPACLGAGVTARRVVFQRSSHTQGGVSLENCLVGEGTRLENGFSAEESLFFANSH